MIAPESNSITAQLIGDSTIIAADMMLEVSGRGSGFVKRREALRKAPDGPTSLTHQTVICACRLLGRHRHAETGRCAPASAKRKAGRRPGLSAQSPWICVDRRGSQ